MTIIPAGGQGGQVRADREELDQMREAIDGLSRQLQETQRILAEHQAQCSCAQLQGRVNQLDMNVAGLGRSLGSVEERLRRTTRDVAGILTRTPR